MTARLSPHAPAGTPVWINVKDNTWVAAETIDEPYRVDVPRGAFYRVELRIGSDTHDYPVARVSRGRG